MVAWQRYTHRGSAILTDWLDPGITATHVAVNIQPSSRKTRTAVTEGGIATSFKLASTHIYGPMWHTQRASFDNLFLMAKIYISIFNMIKYKFRNDHKQESPVYDQ